MVKIRNRLISKQTNEVLGAQIPIFGRPRLLCNLRPYSLKLLCSTTNIHTFTKPVCYMFESVFQYQSCSIFCNPSYSVLVSAMSCQNPQNTDTFLSQLDKVRVELRESVARAHQVLEERESVLLSELEQLENSYRGGVVIRQIDQLRRTKAQMECSLTDNVNQETLKLSVAPLNTRIEELEYQLENTRARLKEVALRWDDTTLHGVLQLIGSIEVRRVPDYKSKQRPIVLAGKHKKESSITPGEFLYPRYIAIHPETNNIYICDCGNNRIQVFDRSLKYQFMIGKQMKSPAGICIHLNRLYVTQPIHHSVAEYSIVGKFIRCVGREGVGELEFSYPKGISISTQTGIVYICDWLNDRVHCLNLDLTFNSFIHGVSHPKDVKVTSGDILVLTGGCIQVYNKSHKLMREIVFRIPTEPSYFCLDIENNIILSAQSVMVFSFSGELIHEFGEFDYLSGVALDSNDRVIVASENKESCIQLF